MPAYFDTSAVVPLVVQEPSSFACRRVWRASDAVLCSRLAYVEVAAALAMATRLGRITESQRLRAWEAFLRIWHGVDIIETTQGLVESASEMALTHSLRGYDAVHCAAAVMTLPAAGVAVSGDAALLRAWTQLGVSTANTSAAAPPETSEPDPND